MVKSRYEETLDLDDFEPKHLPYLLEQVRRRMAHDLGYLDGGSRLRARHAPLRSASFRLISLIPSHGARITDLAKPAGMTKQALGQLLEVLVANGYVIIERSPDDGRVRLASRTKKGDRLAAELTSAFDQLRDHYRTVLGARRCDQLYALLTQLAVGWDG
jgi:DNA-binding MarR family transcriptional regulator